MDVVVFDKDSTLFDTSGRHGLINREDRDATDWVAYSKACDLDLPNHGTIALARLLHRKGVVIVVLTGANEEAEREVRVQLDEHDVPFDFLLMRRADETRSNGAMKVAYLREFMARFPDADIHFVVEDWGPAADDIYDGLEIPAVVINPRYSEKKPEVESIEAESAYLA